MCLFGLKDGHENIIPPWFGAAAAVVCCYFFLAH